MYRLEGFVVEETVQDVEGHIGLVSRNHMAGTSDSHEVKIGSVLGVEAADLSIHVVLSGCSFDLKTFRLQRGRDIGCFVTTGEDVWTSNRGQDIMSKNTHRDSELAGESLSHQEVAGH